MDKAVRDRVQAVLEPHGLKLGDDERVHSITRDGSVSFTAILESMFLHNTPRWQVLNSIADLLNAPPAKARVKKTVKKTTKKKK
jgi:hypothetical protein